MLKIPLSLSEHIYFDTIKLPLDLCVQFIFVLGLQPHSVQGLLIALHPEITLSSAPGTI